MFNALKGADGVDGADGTDGKSALELAREIGLIGPEGTITDMFNALKGADGKSAYDLYVEIATAAGETPLSFTDWLASLKGDTGAAGVDGLSAYELYLQGQANTWFTANPADQTTYEAYVAGLEEGGVALSASDWLEANVPAYATVLTDAGTETEAKWLESLKGTDGKDAYVLSKPVIAENSEETLAGTAKAGETVVILDGSGNIVTEIPVTAADGTFTISPNPLAGEIGSIYVTNALGEISDSFTLVGAADTTAPDLPVILLNDETQLSGTAEPNAKVIVIADGQAYETTVGPDGTWSFADINGPFNPLVKEGVSAAIIYAEDSAGNDSDPSLVFISENTALVDLIESVVVVDDLNADDVINAFELGNDGQIQLDVNLGIDAAVGDLISVNGYNYVLNQTDIDATKITVSVNAREGENILVVTGINATGQTERLQDSILVDTTAGTVTLDSVQPLDTLPLSETLLNDMFINALESTNTVKLVGTAEPGSTLSITVQGITEPFTVIADSITGQWSIDLTSAQLDMLADGEVSVTGTATDQAGNTVQLSGSVTLDTQAPSIVITIAEDGIVTVIPTEPLYINGTLASLSDIADELTSSVAGSFTVLDNEIQFTPTTSGYYGDITVTLPADTFTDLAGNPAGVVTATDLINFADAPTVLITSDEYSVVAGQTTLITFTFSELVNGFELSDVSTNGAGTLSNLTQDLNNPLIYTAIFTPIVTDALTANITVVAGSYVSATTGKLGEAGQLQQLVGSVYENAKITGDTQVPAAPTVSLATDTGVSDSDGITADATVNVGITAGNTWRYSTDGGNTWSTTWFDSTTTSFELPNAGIYRYGDIVVEQRDSAGNVSQGVLAQDVTLDTSTSITITSPTQISSYDKANGYVVQGTAEPNSTVTFTVEGIAKTFETTTDVTGHWTQLISPPDSTTTADGGDADTTITISATATDIAGNTATVTETNIASLTVADAIYVIAGDDIINASEASDGETISGVSDLSGLDRDYGVIYSLDSNGNRVGSPVYEFSIFDLGASSNWTESLTQAQIQNTLGNGQYEVVLFDDRTGLLSPYTYSNPVASRKFTIDLSVDPVTYTVADDDGTLTPIGTAYTTNDSTPTWSGTAEPNSAIEIIIGGKVVGSTVADANGNWTVEANQTLVDDTHTVTIKSTDKAGNTSTDSQHTITVDTVAPMITINEPIAGDNVLTNIEAAQGLTISGTAEGAEVGQTVTVTVEGQTFTTTVELDPETVLPVWNLTLTPAQLSSLSLTNLQVLDISATVTDKAGNVSTPDSATVIYKLADTDVLNTVVALSEADLLSTETISASGAIIGLPSGTSTAYLEEPATDLYVNGALISWTGQNTQELIGSADGVEVIRITLNDLGEYTVTMSQAIEHGEPSTATDTQLAFDVRVNFANARGDVTESHYITVNVTDDVPVLAADRTEALSNTYVVEGNALVKTSADGITTAEINVDGTIFKIDYENQSITQTATGTADKVLAYNHIPAENGAGQLFITTERGELIKFDLDTGAYQYSIFAPLPSDYSTSVPVAVSLGGSNTLLGAVNADVAGLLEFEDSQMFAVQGDGVYGVEIALGNVVDVGGLLGSLLGDPKQFIYNTILANEFGFNVTVTSAVLGIGEATLLIEAKDGSALDTYKVNQLLSTVAIDGGLSELVTVGLIPWTSITAYAQDGTTLATKDSVELANVGLLNDLLSGETVSTILVDSAGRGSTLTKDGALEAWSIYGLDGADKIYGGNEGDHLYGGNGNDLIMGNEGDDYIIGGRGHDILYGGEGSDTFRWEKGDQVMTIGIATDIIKDFNADSAVLGGDILDLKGLLNGGGRLGFMSGNLTNYLHFSYDEVNDQTIIQISTEGEFVGGYQEASHTHLVDQVIVLEGVNLFKSTPSQTTADLHSDYEVIQNLIAQGKLDVALVDQVISSNSTDIDLSVTDTDGDSDTTAITFDTTELVPFGYNPDNQAPWVFGKNTSLLGLVGLDVLSVINLGEQDIFVYDINNDLRKVELEFQQIVAVNVTKPTFGWSARLAQELGLKVEVIENEGVLGLIAPTTTLRITSASTELNISNSAINQLLATVKIGVQEGDLGIVNGDLLSLDVINTMQIRATDSHDLTTTETMGKLLDLDLATTSYRLNGDVNLVEGTDESDTNLDQSAASGSVLIYGYNGDDTITGSAYNDVIYGGIGNDVIHGGAGNDLIYGGAGDDTIHGGSGLNILNGGAGADTFVSTSGAQDVVIYDLQANDATGGHGQDTWNGFKVANVAFDTDADMLDLSELIADSFDEAHAQSLLENDATAYFSYMAQFIQLEQVADGSTINTLVKVDRDGSGEAFSATSLVTLTGVATDLEQLLQNGQILY
ncbi:Ig-like domain-containing protein [Acinetobacter indicus]|uniref:Ig-like domain-containing protein n=1 Tax=Acinetobacter indicus TaxID=756892 RepID=UPI00257781B8|nr:Ig-like domain-containing protein [Acinetobacter indicus]